MAESRKRPPALSPPQQVGVGRQRRDEPVQPEAEDERQPCQQQQHRTRRRHGHVGDQPGAEQPAPGVTEGGVERQEQEIVRDDREREPHHDGDRRVPRRLEEPHPAVAGEGRREEHGEHVAPPGAVSPPHGAHASAANVMRATPLGVVHAGRVRHDRPRGVAVATTNGAGVPLTMLNPSDLSLIADLVDVRAP